MNGEMGCETRRHAGSEHLRKEAACFKSSLYSGRLLCDGSIFQVPLLEFNFLCFAHLFEEIIQVLSRLIVETPRIEKESNKAFEARRRLLARLSSQVGFDIGKGEIERSSWGTKQHVVGGEQAIIHDVVIERK